jgi:hypothetical protein
MSDSGLVFEVSSIVEYSRVPYHVDEQEAFVSICAILGAGNSSTDIQKPVVRVEATKGLRRASAPSAF